MANRKISDLTELTASATGDLLPIVDISEAAAADKNKKITIEKLFQGIPGNIRIGTTGDGFGSTTGRIRLTGNTGGINSIYTEQSVSGGYNFASSTISNGGTYYHVNFLEGGTQRGSITSNGTATSYTTSSDYRLKENVVAVTDGIARFKQLKPSRFNFISHPGHTVEGFLAHEAQAVVPGCVTGEKDAVDEDGNPVYQGIDQSKLVPLLTTALQEAIARIETLETRLSALEGA